MLIRNKAKKKFKRVETSRLNGIFLLKCLVLVLVVRDNAYLRFVAKPLYAVIVLSTMIVI